ncbi:MAG: purine nucleoside phosphoramidase, Hit-like protein involved in cell-cycle regulation [Candidatus Gottesmanbacteria bacterium GW2011_GWA2_43_14]|uniref:Purine nucleoside phosphoramidase, Hit-like protein involved in cell-cycle regulation n=1 Tax=Candidatus Gottesmanbacteria bacterium GW2011_GWA2_43_14 TaxID=1618443 RepID=A0A0G1DIF6_9BACT|nr:MAG: purine nucleoside phosphoramidase, Hit-like protein involved in cell-cycle regulation [Candidatus Gottesmanbacteria bacterium GW2011_GWA2_43_14]
MNGCVFCKIVKKEIPAKEVYRDGEIVAFRDINPKAPVHILVIPVKHLEDLSKAGPKDRELLGKLLYSVKEIAAGAGLEKSGYKLISNNGIGSGQLVFHLHFHILGGWQKKPEWQV